MPDTRPTFYGSFRESNATHLEVLDVSTVVGVPIEVDVFDGASPATMLATLEAASGVSFAIVKDDVGSGQFTLPQSDPKAVYLQRGNLVKFRVGGVHRFAIWLDEPKLIPAAEGAAARYECGGQGVASTLDRGVLYTSHEFTNAPLGAILRELVDEQLAKSPSPLTHLTVDFTATIDSQGANWDDSATMGLSAGASLLDVWKQLVSLGLESRVTHTLRLQAFKELGVHRDGTSGAEPVVLRQGRHFTIDPELVGRGGGEKSRVLVIGEGGATFEVVDPAIEAEPRIGRRETALSFGSADPTTMQRAGSTLLEALQLESAALKLPVAHGLDEGDYEPFLDYNVGDWVLIDIPGALELVPHRIVGMQIDQGDTPFDWSVTLDLNSYSLEADLRLKRQIDALGGSQVSGGGVSNVSLGSSTIGPSATASGKVAVQSGDSLEYLYSKVDAIAPLAKALGGTSSQRRLELSLIGLALSELLDVDTTGLADGDALVYDQASGLFVPGAVGGGGGPGGGSSGATIVGTSSDTGATPLNLAKPAGLQAGDLLLIAANTVNSTAATAPTGGGGGWSTEFRFDTSSNEWQALWYKVADASDVAASEFTVTHSAGTDSCAALVAIRGVDTRFGAGLVTDSALLAPAILGKSDGLEVVVFMALQGGGLLTLPDHLTEAIQVMASSTNNPRILIAHRDCEIGAAMPQWASGNGGAAAYNLAWAGVFY